MVVRCGRALHLRLSAACSDLRQHGCSVSVSVSVSVFSFSQACTTPVVGGGPGHDGWLFTVGHSSEQGWLTNCRTSMLACRIHVVVAGLVIMVLTIACILFGLGILVGACCPS